MPPRRRLQNDRDDPNDPYPPGNVFVDSDEELSDAETDISEKKPFDDAGWHVEEQDLPDLIEAGLPPEYYHRIANEINNIEFDTPDYSPGTLSLLNAVEDDWKR